MKAKIHSIALAVLIMLSLFGLMVKPVSASDYPWCDYQGEVNFVWVFIGGFQPRPVLAHTSEGDTISLWGNGVVANDTSISGLLLGSFIYSDPTGQTVINGTFRSTKLIKALRYGGCNPENELWPGGRAVVEIILKATDGKEYPAVIDMQSPFGFPPPGAYDGFRLRVKDWGLYFDQPVSYPENIIFDLF
jgi:hypothetical protein